MLATKAGISARRGGRSYNTSRGHLLATLDGSLRRLGVDHVDLWQVHIWSDDTPLEETLAALDHAVTSGRASYVGISNYTGWQTAQAATWQRAVPGRSPLASTQVEYSLLNRAVEHEVLPAAAALGLGVLPWSPLGRGVLTGKYRTGTPSDSRAASTHFANFVDPYLDERGAAIVEAVARAADGLGWSALEVALTWVRDRPGVTAPIVGARTAAQLRGALGVEELTLPAEIDRRPRRRVRRLTDRRLTGDCIEPCATPPARSGCGVGVRQGDLLAGVLPQRRHQAARRARRARRLGARPGPDRTRRHPPGGAAAQDHPRGAHRLSRPDITAEIASFGPQPQEKGVAICGW